MKCLACGIEKDLNVKETYPYQEEDGICDVPIAPFMVLEIQPIDEKEDWRMTVVCHECFHKLNPDQWIHERGWETLNPVVPFDRLPKEKEDKFNLLSYIDTIP